MCRRFMAVGVNDTGSANDAGLGAVGRSMGLVSGDMPAGTTSPVDQWRVAHFRVELADVSVGVPVEEPPVNVLTLEAI